MLVLVPGRGGARARLLGGGLALTLVAGLLGVGAVPASGADGAGVKPPAQVPNDASAETKAQIGSAAERLAALEKQAAATTADLRVASARLAQAHQAAAAADERAAQAQGAADTAFRELGQYAAGAYMGGGPMASAAAFLASDNPTELMHTAGLLAQVGSNQANALQRLRVARGEAERARSDALQARQTAAAAQDDARRLAAESRVQLAQAETLLRQLQAKATKEARAAQARRLAAIRAAMQGPDAGLGLLPPSATGPAPKPGLPPSAGPDPGDGPQGADHLRPRAERAQRLIMAIFHVTDIGGWRPSDEVSDDHPQGRAIDVMMSSGGVLPDPAHLDLGWRVARWAQVNAAALGVTYIIWQARIWSVERAGEGWRDYTTNFPYGTNVSPTTLHLDHVHISFG